MEVDEEEDASATEEAAQLPGPEEMEEDAEEEEAEAEEQEQELTVADVLSEAGKQALKYAVSGAQVKSAEVLP